VRNAHPGTLLDMSTRNFVTCSSILASALLLHCSSAPSSARVEPSSDAAGSPAAAGAPVSTGTSPSGTAGAATASSGGAGGTAGALGYAGSSSSVVGTGAGPSAAGGSTSAAGGAAATTGPTNWTLAWSDEFNAADGTPVDATKWMHDLGGSGWGNQELEYYTDGTANAQQVGGNLVITATTAGAAQQTCWNGACQYTSARLLTSGHYTTTYGKIEARIKTPAGKGLWPAFWMLGDNISVVSWPTCGELDIMETIGSDPATLHGSMHGPGYSGASPLTASTKLASGANLSDDFHTYSIEWAPDVVRFYLDSNLYETRTPADMPPGAIWVYNRPFFIILNVAVGGQWPGSPDATTTFPAQMLVDYVRVYSASAN
jgi:beta-glucanase (GH16 family)